jgi:hypothetical protein
MRRERGADTAGRSGWRSVAVTDPIDEPLDEAIGVQRSLCAPGVEPDLEALATPV